MKRRHVQQRRIGPSRRRVQPKRMEPKGGAPSRPSYAMLLLMPPKTSDAMWQEILGKIREFADYFDFILLDERR